MRWTVLNRLVYTPDTPYSGPDTLQLSLNDPGDGLTGMATSPSR